LEVCDGDFWLDDNPGTVTTTKDGTVNSAVYFSGGWIAAGGRAERVDVPPNFQYTVLTTAPSPGFVTNYDLNNAPLRNNYGDFVGMSFTESHREVRSGKH
jgi:hypothetical protein